MIVKPGEASGASLTLGAEAVGLLFGKSGRTIYRWAAARPPLFPAPIRDPGGEIVWARKDVELFVACDCSMARYRIAKRKD